MTTLAGNLSLAMEIGVGRRGLAFGIRQAAVPLAGLLAGSSVGPIAVPFGWRWTFLGAAFLPFGGLAVSIVGAVVVYAGGWGWPGLFHFGVVAFHPEAPGAATGVAQLGLAAGGLLGPYAYGAVSSSSGHGRSWLLVAGLTVTAAALIGRGGVLLTRRHRQVSEVRG